MLESRADKEKCGHYALKKYKFRTDLPPAEDSLMKLSLLASYTKRTTDSAAGKHIIKPKRVLYGQVHSVFELHGFKTCSVEYEDGYIHHYRKTDRSHQSSSITDDVEDSTAFRFLGQLIPRLRKLFQLFSEDG